MVYTATARAPHFFFLTEEDKKRLERVDPCHLEMFTKGKRTTIILRRATAEYSKSSASIATVDLFLFQITNRIIKKTKKTVFFLKMLRAKGNG